MGLDPGIKLTVEWLNQMGFHTTDSGDGRSKPEDERVFNVPHVAIEARGPKVASGGRLVHTPGNVEHTADRLLHILKDRGIDVHPMGIITPRMESLAVWIQASYDPVDQTRVVMLFGVDDDLLKAANDAQQALAEKYYQERTRRPR